MHKIKVGWMYPNLLNLHGEVGSVQALVYVGKKLNVDVEIIRIEDFDDPIPYDELDIMIFLPGEIASFRHLIPALEGDLLRNYLENGGHLVAIGTSGLMFGKSILREDGSTLKGLGYLDMTAKERTYVWGDDMHFRLNDDSHELAGSQIQMADVEAANPLGTIIYGMGNNKSGAEGARWKNLIYTNCLGPLFVKNPWFAESIIRDILLKKNIVLNETPTYPIAENSFKSTLQFINSKPKQ